MHLRDRIVEIVSNASQGTGIVAELAPQVSNAVKAYALHGMSAGLSFSAVGDLKDVTEGLSGKDYITGEELTRRERLITLGAAALPFVGGKVLRRSLRSTGKEAEELVRWVDEGGNLRAGESPGMRPNAYSHQSSVPGARSNLLTGRGQAPYLEFTDETGNVIGAKFDGALGTELIDRKLNPFFSAKAVDQATRQVRVAQHYGLQAVWELPTPQAVDAANRFLETNKISGISVRLGPR